MANKSESGNIISTSKLQEKYPKENIEQETDKTKDGIDSAMDEYKGMTKHSYEENGETIEFYMDDENLKIDSTDWKERRIAGTFVKINSTRDIIELCTGKFKGKQLIKHEAAIREAENLGKELPDTNNDNPMTNKIIEILAKEDSINNFVGYWNDCNLSYGYLGGQGEDSYFQTKSNNDFYTIYLFTKNNKFNKSVSNFASKPGFSVRLIKKIKK